jgi:hypothetical protein
MKTKQKLINLGIIILEILAIAPACLFMYLSLGNDLPIAPAVLYIFTAISFAYIPLFVASYVIRLRQIFASKPNKKTLSHTLFDQIVLKTTLGISIIFICITIWLLYSLVNEGVPQFFPLDDPNATYTVETYYDKYMIHYHTDQQTEKNSYQNCQYIAGKQVCTKEYTYDFMVMVGNSPIELTNLRQKRVQIQGKFVAADQQCIVNKCVDMNMAALDIKSIKEIQQ